MIDKLRLQQKRGALLATIGAGISILAFLLLPYLTITVTPSVIGTSSYQTAQISAYAQTITLGTSVIALFSGLIWLEVLLAIAILGIAVLLLLRETPFGNANTPPLMQMRQGAYFLLLLGIVAATFQYFFISMANSQINTFLQTPLVNIPSALSAPNMPITIAALLSRSNLMVAITIGYGFGSWCYLIGAALTLVGGTLILTATGQPAFNTAMGAMPSMNAMTPPLLYPAQQDIAQMPPAQPPHPLYSQSWNQSSISQGQPWSQQPPSSHLP